MATTIFPSITPDRDDEDSDEQLDADVERCGAEKSDGTSCERPADSCQYH